VADAGIAIGGVRQRIHHADREGESLPTLALQENYGISSL
jgi:hypothetical protein